MKTKEELKSTFIRYQPEITKDVFKRIIDRVEQLGFKQHHIYNDYEHFVSNNLVLSKDCTWFVVNPKYMIERPEIEVSDILGDVKWSVGRYVALEEWAKEGQIKWSATLSEAKYLLEQEEAKTMKNKYVEYNEDFTEDMFNHMLDWAKKQNQPYPPYDYYANTFDNFKTKGYFWFGGTKWGYSYGVDNNPQDFDEITFEELFPEYSKPTIKKSKEFDRNWYVKVSSQEEANIVLDWLKNKGEETTTVFRFVENSWSKIWFCLNSKHNCYNTWCLGSNENLPTNLKEKQLSDIVPDYKQSSGCIFLEPDFDDVTVELIDVPDI